jgi:hypothetical protein
MYDRAFGQHDSARRRLVAPFLGGVWVHAEARGEGNPGVRLLWSPEYDPAVISVHAEPVPLCDPEAFDIAAFPNMSHLITDGKGQEYLILDDGQHQVELHVRSGTLADGGARLRCELDLFTGVEPKLLTISRLNAFRRLKRFPASLFPVERRAQKWALALQAFDGMEAGASLREIACALFGEALVRDEWNGRSAFLKSRVQRLLHYGRKMVNGDYKTLLQ